MIKLFNGECLNEMATEVADKSIDLIVCDLPYGQLKCEWDTIISFDKLWEQYNRILKEDSMVILFCSGLFTLDVINSNRKDFKYKLIWKKNVPTGMSSAKYRPMKYYEEICVFQKGKGCYNPIMKERVGVGKACYNYDHYCGKSNHIDVDKVKKKYDPDFVQPSDVLEFNVVPNRKGKLHPTEKPVQLLEYLIKTYSNDGAVVLDNCMGSGSTGEACINTNRQFLGIELSEEYFDKAKSRLETIEKLKESELF
jgi:site-specific DNA-methyltransferase (adenine-specific)